MSPLPETSFFFFQIQLDFSHLGVKLSPDATAVNLGVVTPIVPGLGLVLNVELTVSILGLPHDSFVILLQTYFLFSS